MRDSKGIELGPIAKDWSDNDRDEIKALMQKYKITSIKTLSPASKQAADLHVVIEFSLGKESFFKRNLFQDALEEILLVQFWLQGNLARPLPQWYHLHILLFYVLMLMKVHYSTYNY